MRFQGSAGDQIDRAPSHPLRRSSNSRNLKNPMGRRKSTRMSISLSSLLACAHRNRIDRWPVRQNRAPFRHASRAESVRWFSDPVVSTLAYFSFSTEEILKFRKASVKDGSERASIRTYSCRSASMGSRLAARMAGYRPNTMPTAMLMPSESTRLYRLTIVGIPAN